MLAAGTLTSEQINALDVGKLMIDPSILEKKGKLTDEEYAIIKTHVVLANRYCIAPRARCWKRRGALPWSIMNVGTAMGI